MKRSTYILVYALLSVYFWYLFFPVDRTYNDIVLVSSWIWAYLGFKLFKNPSKYSRLNFTKYNKYTYAILFAVFISMFSASFFWGQDFSTTLIAQRGMYSFIFLNTLLYIQPSEEDIFNVLKWISYVTIAVWILSIISPSLIQSIDSTADTEFSKSSTDLGYQIEGYRFVTVYYYYIVYKLLKKYSSKLLFTAVLLFLFILLYQNRSMLIGACVAAVYALVTIKSRYKFFIYFGVSIVISIFIFSTTSIWSSLLEESSDQLNNSDYGRWQSLHYFIFDYSKNWFCYIFGNGYPSGNSSFGKLMWSNMEKGIYGTDVGMIGMWADYGIVPVFCIYSIVYKLLKNKFYPLYLKFLAAHICLVPTIFHFWIGEGVFLMVLLIYLYAYYTESFKLKRATAKRTSTVPELYVVRQ